MNDHRHRNIGQAGAALLIWGAFTLVGVFSAQATTRTVTTLADADNPNDGVLTLREAIAASAAGDTIDFAPSLSGGKIDLANAIGELVIGRSLTIVGPDGGITINGNQQYGHRILRVAAGSVSISNCTISGGYEVGTPGIAGNSSSPTGSEGGDGLGGGIANFGTLMLTNCRVINNRTYGGAGGNGYSGTTTYSQGGDGGIGRGGGVYNSGQLTLVNSTISDNAATGGLGGYSYTVTPNNIRSRAGGRGFGGGVYNETGAFLTMLGCTVDNNLARGGSGGAGQKGAAGGDGGAGVGAGLHVR